MDRRKEHTCGKNVPYIHYMEIETPLQFAEYCEKVEKFKMPLEAAEYILNLEKEINGKFYVKQDVLHITYKNFDGFITDYSTNLSCIKERMEEEVVSCEELLGINVNEIEEGKCKDGITLEPEQLLDGGYIPEVLEELDFCMRYHELFDALWKKLEKREQNKKDLSCKVAKLTWDIS